VREQFSLKGDVHTLEKRSVSNQEERIMEINMADVTLHVNETRSKADREQLEGMLRALDGVVSVANHDERPHLMVVEYNPDMTDSSSILTTARDSGIHAQLIGL
jgi:hypothetical protein